jgi:hypothetical protein
MDWMPLLEALSYLVTIVGLPFAIIVFVMEQRKERLGEEEEIYQRLADEYASFLRLVLEHSDLHLRMSRAPNDLTDEQKERKVIILDLLVSLFERAYILVYEEKMTKQVRRLWQTWEDYMREWCRRDDFRNLLPQLLVGEDPDFVVYIQRIAREESAHHSTLPS